jgi:transcriptional regulator of met regulon
VTGLELNTGIFWMSTILTIVSIGISILNYLKIDRTQSDVKKIELATNSMKDALVEATATGEHAKGFEAGRQTEKDDEKRRDRG